MSSSRSNQVKALLVLGILTTPVSSFLPRRQGRVADTTQLFEVIRGEDEEAPTFDLGLGGVRLAQESAIKISGEVKHKPGLAEARPAELLRYNNMKELEEGKVQDVLGKVGSTILCSGQGTEIYKNPGDTLETVVVVAPMEAIKEAFKAAASAIESEKLVFNFLGGDELMMGEVLEATNEMVVMLDIATRAKVSFNSLCHSSIPKGDCAVTVVSVGSNVQEEGAEFSGVEKAVASGEIYLRDGAWWTVDESEINTAVA